MPKNPRSYEKTRHIALSGLLFALAMALSFIEGSLVIPGLLPGMKLGLALHIDQSIGGTQVNANVLRQKTHCKVSPSSFPVDLSHSV